MSKTPNGILPTKTWLWNHGQKDLVCAMVQKPDSFAHMFQDVEPEDEGTVKLAQERIENLGQSGRREWSDT